MHMAAASPGSELFLQGDVTKRIFRRADQLEEDREDPANRIARFCASEQREEEHKITQLKKL